MGEVERTDARYFAAPTPPLSHSPFPPYSRLPQWVIDTSRGLA
jgi:hypothetical protein